MKNAMEPNCAAEWLLPVPLLSFWPVVTCECVYTVRKEGEIEARENSRM